MAIKIENVQEFKRKMFLSEKTHVYIVGAGRYGEIIGQYLNKQGIQWVGYVDKRDSLNILNGKKVLSYNELDNDGYYIIATYLHRKEIESELEKRGINSQHIFMLEDQDIFYDIYDNLVHWREHTDRLKKFYKIHDGKRCFIIGNGPSLRIEDLDKLKEEITFASNSIYALYEYTQWRPTYYCATDSIFLNQVASDKQYMMKVLEGCEAAFTSILGKGVEYRDDQDMRHLHYMHVVHNEFQDNLPRFSVDCSEKVYAAGTVTYEMLQLAVYMGIRRIYLLGIDCNYAVEYHKDGSVTRNNLMNHMKEIEVEDQRFYQSSYERYGEQCYTNIDLHLAGYQAAKTFAETHNVDIYNATRGGKLEVFERINFDELL